MIKCAIFDMDGTLVDSMTYWSTAAFDYLTSLNLVSEKDLGNKFLAMSLPESADYMIKTYNLNKSKEEVCQGIDDVMESRYRNDVKIKPYFKELLEEFKKLGIKMAIATSTDKYLVEICLKRLNIRDYFEFIITSTEVGKSKKNPDIYERCSDYFGIPYSESIVFEDLPYGIISSSKAGFHTVGIYDSPSEMHQPVIRQNAEFYYKEFNMDSVNELVKIVKSL